MHRTLKAAIFQRNPPTTFLASQASDLIFKCQVQSPAFGGLFQRAQATEEQLLPPAHAPSRGSRKHRPSRGPGLPWPLGPSALLPTPGSAAKFLRSTRRPRWGHPDGAGSPGARAAGRARPPSPARAARSRRRECRRGPRAPAPRPPLRTSAATPALQLPRLPAPAPHGAGRARYLPSAGGPAASSSACCSGRRSRCLSRRPSSRGAGSGAPGAGATPRRAQLWPRPRGLRAPGAPRTAGRRSHGRPRPGPLRRRQRRPRGPRSGRRAAGGTRGAWAPSPESSPARAAGAALGARRAGPRPALHAAASRRRAAVAGAPRAPLRALPCAFLREPRVSERNFLSPSLLAAQGSRRVVLVRGSQLSHCAPARPIQAVLFLQHLV